MRTTLFTVSHSLFLAYFLSLDSLRGLLSLGLVFFFFYFTWGDKQTEFFKHFFSLSLSLHLHFHSLHSFSVFLTTKKSLFFNLSCSFCRHFFKLSFTCFPSSPHSFNVSDEHHSFLLLLFFSLFLFSFLF